MEPANPVAVIVPLVGVLVGVWVARRRGHRGMRGAFLGSSFGSAVATGVLALVGSIFSPPTLIGPIAYTILATVAGACFGAVAGVFAVLCVWAAGKSS